MAAKIKKGDDVIVLSGRDRGREGSVLEVRPQDGRAIVSGIHMVSRHTKADQTKQGGIIKKEATIDLSNLALKDPKDGKATRVGFKTLDNGKKVRVAKRSGETLDN